MRLTQYLAGAAACLMAAGAASAVTPVSYTFNQPANCGTYCYLDPGFTKLTDGVIGYAGWAINNAAPWVGWEVGDTDVNIDFDFGSAKTISAVDFNTTQDNPGDVTLPSLNIYESNDDVNWVLKGSLVVPVSNANNHDPYGDYGPPTDLIVGDLGIDARYVRVQTVGEGPWTFVDEVTFSGAGVPEPAAWALMLAGFGGVGGAMRMARARVVATA